MSLKRVLRLIMLILFIVLASLVPIPIPSFNKSKLPNNLIELVEKDTEEEDEDDIIPLF